MDLWYAPIQGKLTSKHKINDIFLVIGINRSKEIIASTVESVTNLISFPATSFCVTLRENAFVSLASNTFPTLLTIQGMKCLTLFWVKVWICMVLESTIFTTSTRECYHPRNDPINQRPKKAKIEQHEQLSVTQFISCLTPIHSTQTTHKRNVPV